jgi:hypothetical protein
MKIDKVAGGYSRKFNLGNYNSLELEVTCWADLEEGDDPVMCIVRLQDLCREAVKREFSALRSRIAPGQSATAKSQIPA